MAQSTNHLKIAVRSVPTVPEPYLAARECAACAHPLGPRFGWCGVCAKAFCLVCARQHVCRPDCLANGCRAGLCVRLVDDGKLLATWGLSAD